MDKCRINIFNFKVLFERNGRKFRAPIMKETRNRNQVSRIATFSERNVALLGSPVIQFFPVPRSCSHIREKEELSKRERQRLHMRALSHDFWIIVEASLCPGFGCHGSTLTRSAIRPRRRRGFEPASRPRQPLFLVTDNNNSKKSSSLFAFQNRSYLTSTKRSNSFAAGDDCSNCNARCPT